MIANLHTYPLVIITKEPGQSEQEIQPSYRRNGPPLPTPVRPHGCLPYVPRKIVTTETEQEAYPATKVPPHICFSELLFSGNIYLRRSTDEHRMANNLGLEPTPISFPVTSMSRLNIASSAVTRQLTSLAAYCQVFQQSAFCRELSDGPTPSAARFCHFALLVVSGPGRETRHPKLDLSVYETMPPQQGPYWPTTEASRTLFGLSLSLAFSPDPGTY